MSRAGRHGKAKYNMRVNCWMGKNKHGGQNWLIPPRTGPGS